MKSHTHLNSGASADSTLDSWEGRTATELAEEWQVPRVVLLSEVGSTNDFARSLAADSAPVGTTVLAEQQLAGRGRSGRSWASPPGLGLYLSCVARPGPEELPTYPLRVGMAVARAVDRWTSGEVRIKWPNDLYLHGRKLGGILCEASWTGTTLEYAIVGIGLNVLHTPGDFPPDFRQTATSIRSAAPLVSRLEVARAVVKEVVGFLKADAENSLDDDLLAELNHRHAFHGRMVDVLEPDSGSVLLSGRAEGISADGSLRIVRGGEAVSVRSGTLRLSRTDPD